QRRADAVALPRPLDREGGLRLARYRRPDRAQLGGPAQDAGDEEAVDPRIDAEREIGIVAYEVVGHRAGKTIAPAVGVEPQQVLGIALGLADPQFADQAATRQSFMHRWPRVVVEVANRARDIAVQYKPCNGVAMTRS